MWRKRFQCWCVESETSEGIKCNSCPSKSMCALKQNGEKPQQVVRGFWRSLSLLWCLQKSVSTALLCTWPQQSTEKHPATWELRTGVCTEFGSIKIHVVVQSGYSAKSKFRMVIKTKPNNSFCCIYADLCRSMVISLYISVSLSRKNKENVNYILMSNILMFAQSSSKCKVTCNLLTSPLRFLF